MRSTLAAVTAIPLLTLTGCAAIIEGSGQNIQVRTASLQSASCTVQNDRGSSTIVAPSNVTVKRSKSDLHVRCNDPANTYQGEQVVESGLEDWWWGNVALLSPLGFFIDGVSGAMWEYPEDITVAFRPAGYSATPAPMQYTAPVATAPVQQPVPVAPAAIAAPVPVAPAAAPAAVPPTVHYYTQPGATAPTADPQRIPVSTITYINPQVAPAAAPFGSATPPAAAVTAPVAPAPAVQPASIVPSAAAPVAVQPVVAPQPLQAPYSTPPLSTYYYPAQQQ